MSAEEYLTEKFKDHPLTIKWPEQLPKIMESYAREYHAKEMEKALEEAEKKIENLPLGKDSRSYHGATWLLNHLKEDKG